MRNAVLGSRSAKGIVVEMSSQCYIAVLMELSKGKTGATSVGEGIFEISVAVSGRHSKNTTNLLESIWINQRKIKEVEKHV